MGELIPFSSFANGKQAGINPYYYFADVNPHWSDRSLWVVDIQSSYPVSLGIPTKLIDEQKGALVAIRRWVRDHLSSDVITTRLDKSYHYISRFCGQDGRERISRISVPHVYLVVHFEDEVSQVSFALAHTELVRPITDTDPDHHATAEQIAEAAANPWICSTW